VVHLDASSMFALPGDGRMRSFVIKNISFENLTQTDLFARGWHKSGYLFDISGADTDGWVEGRLSLKFPATGKFKEAVVQVMRFPSPKDYPLFVSVNGGDSKPNAMGSEQVERIVIPLSATSATGAVLSSEQNFPLGAPDTRSRSYRVVNIDFD
jgi:hypothetical protein